MLGLGSLMHLSVWCWVIYRGALIVTYFARREGGTRSPSSCKTWCSFLGRDFGGRHGDSWVVGIHRLLDQVYAKDWDNF